MSAPRLPCRVCERPTVLTPRQAQVMDVLCRGKTNSEIAGELGSSVLTVKSQLAEAYRRLGVRTRVEAALLWRDARADHAPCTTGRSMTSNDAATHTPI